MKFQDSSMYGSKVTAGIKKCDGRMNGQTDKPKAIYPTNFFKVGGITKALIRLGRYAGWFASLLFAYSASFVGEAPGL